MEEHSCNGNSPPRARASQELETGAAYSRGRRRRGGAGKRAWNVAGEAGRGGIKATGMGGPPLGTGAPLLAALARSPFPLTTTQLGLEERGEAD